MPTGPRQSAAGAVGAGMKDYLKEAFFFRWNLLFFLGGLAGAAMTPVADVMMPLVTAVEMSYLAGLSSIPRFRAAIDAKVHAARRAAGGAGRRVDRAVARVDARRTSRRRAPAVRTASQPLPGDAHHCRRRPRRRRQRAADRRRRSGRPASIACCGSFCGC